MRISSCLAQPENFQPAFTLANYYEIRKRGNSMKKALRITLNSIMSITIVGLGVATSFTAYHDCTNTTNDAMQPATQNFQNRGMRGMKNNSQMPNDGQMPPEIPNGERPNGQTPPQMPNNSSQSSIIETTATTDEQTNVGDEQQTDTQTEGQDANASTIAKRSEGVTSPASTDLLPYFIGAICETFGASTLLTYLIISRFNKYSIKELMSHKK
jgi:cytoskeletal protein RodZ